MAKDSIILNYNNYDNGIIHFNFLAEFVEGTIEKVNQTKDDYEAIDSSIFETSTFPVDSYIDDLNNAISNSKKIIYNSSELAKYVVDNFNGAEEAIEADINKFKQFMEELFGTVSFDGFHFESEDLVYWEPGTEGYTAQGYTETDEYKIISTYKKGSNSRLYYYDKNTGKFIGYIELNNQAHVGGTTYDPEDGLLFVTGDDGKVNCYDHNAIEDALKANTQHNSEHFIIDLNSKQYESIEIECNINIKEELKTDDAATIYYHNGKIYVSTYRTKGDLVSYDINCNRNQGKVDLDVGQMHVISHNCPSAIQGISIFERDGKTYVAFARSAKYSPSSIDVYELNDDETLGDFSGSTSFKHQGLEGIKVNDDGTVTGIYEYEGSTTLDKNIDDIIGNGEKNKHDSSYNAKANFWNKTIHGLNNSSYDEAIAREEMEKNPYANYYY